MPDDFNSVLRRIAGRDRSAAPEDEQSDFNTVLRRYGGKKPHTAQEPPPDDWAVTKARLDALGPPGAQRSPAMSNDAELNAAIRRLSKARHLDLSRPPAPMPPALPPTVTRGPVSGPLRTETFADVLRRVRGITPR
ncbi:hypothetical protein BH23CHL7_BH23CHL7_20860 [soil metagenome]